MSTPERKTLRASTPERKTLRAGTPERRTPATGLGYPRAARITRGAELQQLMREGKRIRTTHLEVRIHVSPHVRADTHETVPSAEESPRRLRVGIIVPLFSHTAVARNRLKRRLRELVRLHVLSCPVAGEVVMRVRPSAYDANYATLAASIDMLVVALGQHTPVGGSGS